MIITTDKIRPPSPQGVKTFDGEVTLLGIDGCLRVVGADHDTVIYGFPYEAISEARIETGHLVRITVLGIDDPHYERVPAKDRVTIERIEVGE